MDLFLLLDDCHNLGPIIQVIKTLITILRIVVPILLLVLGAIDLAKAVIASDEKEIKASTSRLIKRAIAAVAIFFIVTIVNVIMGMVGSENWKNCWDNPGGEDLDAALDGNKQGGNSGDSNRQDGSGS